MINLDRQQHPAGTRILFNYRRLDPDSAKFSEWSLRELFIGEWSPSGRHIYVSIDDGPEHWQPAYPIYNPSIETEAVEIIQPIGAPP